MTGYTASSITVLQGLESVRQVPAMYIGSTDSNGLHHLLQEVIDNSIDEHLAGHCDKIGIEIFENCVRVVDNGRGIPSEIHPTTEVSTVETVLTTLHAGGKFHGKGKESYRVSSGLHGVGVSVVNALSSHLKVTVKRVNEGSFTQEYQCGIPTYPLKKVSDSVTRSGTDITFTPDSSIFEDVEFKYDRIATRLIELSYLNPNLTFVLHDRRIDSEKEVITSKLGLVQFVTDLIGEKGSFSSPIEWKVAQNNWEARVCLQYAKSTDETVLSYVNNINTRNGGTHVTAFKLALTKVLTQLIEESKLNKTGVELNGDDLRAGLHCVISLLHTNPQFEGQTKHKLNNTDVRTELRDCLTGVLYDWFKKNTSILAYVVDRAIQLANIRASASKKKELLSVKEKIESAVLLPGRLTSCSSRKPEECELFIVEGLSAAGSACAHRETKTQSVLALKGKILNTYGVDEKQILKNQEIASILIALGIGADRDLAKLRYHKIIMLTDADHDGDHIRALLLTFFCTYLPELVESGYVYVGRPPLYRVKTKKATEYFLNDEQLNAYLSTLSESYEIMRAKGLGEMLSEELYETTMKDGARELIQVELDQDVEQLLDVINDWCGVDTANRKRQILESIEDNETQREAKLSQEQGSEQEDTNQQVQQESDWESID